MIASLLAFAIGVQPLPPPEAEAPPATPTEAARAWLAALRDGKGAPSPGPRPRKSGSRVIWALASLTGPNRTVAIRIGVRPGDAGPRVERLEVTVDYTYVDVEKRPRILIR